MGLKLLAALLPIVIPRDAREHVMGDLIERASAKDSNGFERGLRLRDVVNVLPRVWFAHVRRAWFGPVPKSVPEPNNSPSTEERAGWLSTR
jgi:hypothetical protein